MRRVLLPAEELFSDTRKSFRTIGKATGGHYSVELRGEPKRSEVYNAFVQRLFPSDGNNTPNEVFGVLFGATSTEKTPTRSKFLKAAGAIIALQKPHIGYFELSIKPGIVVVRTGNNGYSKHNSSLVLPLTSQQIDLAYNATIEGREESAASIADGVISHYAENTLRNDVDASDYYARTALPEDRILNNDYARNPEHYTSEYAKSLADGWPMYKPDFVILNNANIPA